MVPATSHRSALEKPLVHLAGCDALDVPPEDIDPLADIAVTQDELIAYALAVRPLYDNLGRLIGQLAGLFLLAQVSGRFDRDFEAVTTPIERARECSDAIRSIAAPKGASRRHWALCRAMSLVGEVTDQFASTTYGQEHVREQVSAWTDQLKRANALVRLASDASLGLNPVDFSQACCCCSG
ncbi:hypothetical protein P3W85_35765 [Cupriavidus basilensis]|uniref:Uncharacterized protein n=1 Tax=Cupriavidus basilensis TaxID=68895 RepID=A0ABT6B047_9BURK|nr:hypothetical protein [Cupriavidus basilensis]MDF3838251.1 hypothetical protein [Cupriavidus basilensis]